MAADAEQKVAEKTDVNPLLNQRLTLYAKSNLSEDLEILGSGVTAFMLMHTGYEKGKVNLVTNVPKENLKVFLKILENEVKRLCPTCSEKTEVIKLPPGTDTVKLLADLEKAGVPVKRISEPEKGGEANVPASVKRPAPGKKRDQKTKGRQRSGV